MATINWNIIKKNWVASAILFICIILYAYTFYKYYTAFYNNGLSKNTTDWGTFSNYIGGIVGTILSFFSGVLIYLTYTNGLKPRLQQFETTFFNLLQNQREILKSMKGYIETCSDGSGGEKEASEYINTISSELDKFFYRAKGHWVDNETSTDIRILANKEQSYETIDRNYKIIYKNKHAELGHYFRHLYHIFKYVDESKIENRKKYIDIIQA